MSFLSTPIQDILIKPKRQIGTIEVNVVASENANDVLEITQQPVQQGAMIADHAFKKPTTFAMQAFFRDNLTTPLSKIYQQLLDLQSSRFPFDVITPKRIYRNMLIQSLGQTTDKATENCLSIAIVFQQIIIVNVSTIQSRSIQKNPGRTGATEKAGRKQPESSIHALFGGA